MTKLLKNLSSRIFLCLLICLSTQLFAQTDNLSLVASKSYSPPVYQNADTSLMHIARFAIPNEINVISGNAGNHTATFTFVDNSFLGSGASITVTYKGGASTGNPTSPAEILKGKKYIFQSSSNGMQAGDSVYATGFHLKINNGDNVAGPTVGQLSINHKKLFLNGTIIYNGSGVPVDTIFTYTTVIPSFLIQPLATACPSLCGTNLVTDGDFQNLNCANFNNSFTSDYTCTATPTPGRFGITNNAQSLNQNWSSAGNITNFMAVDGSDLAANTVVWRQQNINVVAGNNYCFSVFVKNIFSDMAGAIAPNITMNVNGVPLTGGASGSIFVTAGWVTNAATYQATVTGPVTLSIVLTSFGFGNDIALDNISFTSLAPQNLTVTANPPFICSTPAQTTLTVTGAPAGTVYTWTGDGVVQTTSNITTAAPTTTTTYTVVGISPAGVCLGSGNVTVQVGPPITLTATRTQICTGENSTICATAPVTPLAPGDIAILRYFKPSLGFGNCSITFVPLVNLPAGTTINFTSSAWNNNSSSFTSIGNTFPYTTGTIPAGTPVTINVGSFFTSNNSGEHIFAYQGPAMSPAFIYGLSTKPWITSGATTNTTSYLPPALSNGLTAVSLNVVTANVFYNIAANAGNANAILTQIGNSANWSQGASLLPYSFTMTGVAIAGFGPWTEVSGKTFVFNGPCTPVIPGTSTSSITVSQPGVYTVTYTDIHGCKGTASQTITPSFTLIANANPNPFCGTPGSIVTLTVFGGPAGTTYTWVDNTGNSIIGSPNGSSIQASPVVTSTYTVTGTSPAGCVENTTVIVTVAPPPSIIATAAPATLCGTPGGPVILTASGGTPGTNFYHWNVPAPGPVVTVFPLTTTTYHVSGAVIPGPGGVPTGCPSTGHIVVGVSALPVVTLTATNTTLCQGDQSTLCATAPPARLFPGDIAIIRNKNTSFGGVPKEIDFVTLVDLPAGTQINFTTRGWNNITSSFIAAGSTITYTSTGIAAGNVVSILPPPGFLLSNAGDQILAYQVIGGNTSFVYGLSTIPWITAGVPTNNTSYLPPALTNGYTAVSLNVNSANIAYNSPGIPGNANAVLSSVSQASNWIVDLTARTYVFSTPLPGAATSGFTWSGGAFTPNGPCNPGTNTSSITVSASGTYTVTYTDIHGCVGNAAVIITVIPTPVAGFTIGATSSLCLNGPVSFTNTSTNINGSTTYLWNFGADAIPATSNVQTPPAVRYQSAGTKTVSLTVTNPGCTSNTFTAQITIDGACCPVTGYQVLGAAGVETPFTGPLTFSGIYKVDGPIRFQSGTFTLTPGTIFYMEGGTKFDDFSDIGSYIAVGDFGTSAELILNSATITAFCDKMWAGIVLVGQNTITTQGTPSEMSEISHSYFGVGVNNESENGNIFRISHTRFFNNYFASIFNDQYCFPCTQNVNFYVQDCIIDSDPNTMRSPYNKTSSFNQYYAQHGILMYLSDSQLKTIQNNTIRNCLYGMRISGNINIQNNILSNNYVAGIYNDQITGQTIIGGPYIRPQIPSVINGNNITIPSQLVNTIDINSAATVVGISADGQDYIISNNIIQNNAANPNLDGKDQTGIYASTNGAYNINSNTISKLDRGVQAYNFTNASPNIFNNNFQFNIRGINVPMNPASSLAAKFTCNTFNISGNMGTTTFGINVNGSAFLNNQVTFAQPAGNRYSNINEPVHNDGTNPFTYFRYNSSQENIGIILGSGSSSVTTNFGLSPFQACQNQGYSNGVNGFRIAGTSFSDIQEMMDSVKYNVGTDGDINYYIYQIIKYHSDNNMVPDLETYCTSLPNYNMEAYNTISWYLIDYYVKDGQVNKAIQMKNDLISKNPSDIEALNRSDYYDVYWRIKHVTTARNYKATDADLATLDLVANSGTSHSENACFLLRYYKPHNNCNIEPNLELQKERNEQKSIKAVLNQNVPNPAKNETTISYSLPDKFSSAKIIISDMVTQASKEEYILNDSKGNIHVDLRNFGDGVYVYYLIVDGILTDSKKMVVIH
jgi:hypothetical protein